jgi:hypothetical protein
MWNDPRAMGGRDADAGMAMVRGGSGSATKRKAAARTAAAIVHRRRDGRWTMDDGRITDS